jgi:hypothetical protein
MSNGTKTYSNALLAGLITGAIVGAIITAAVISTG